MGGVRKIESETGFGSEDYDFESGSGLPLNFKTLNSHPALCPSLPRYNIHSIYTIPFIPYPDPAFSQKFKSGSESEKFSRLRIRSAPDPCPSLLDTRYRFLGFFYKHKISIEIFLHRHTTAKSLHFPAEQDNC